VQSYQVVLARSAALSTMSYRFRHPITGKEMKKRFLKPSIWPKATNSSIY